MLKKSNKISLEEATRLAILGKLPLNEEKEVKTESTTVTTTDDNLTVVETDDANIVIEPKENAAVDVEPDLGAAELPVETPVEEPIIDEPIADDTIVDEPVEEPVIDEPVEEIPEEEDSLEESKKIEEGEAPLFKKVISKHDIKKVESKLEEGEAPLFKKKINKTDIKKVENVEKELDLTKSKKEEHKLAVKENRIRGKKTETIEATEIHYIDDFNDLRNFCWGSAAQQTLDIVSDNDKEDDLMYYLEDITGGEIDATSLNDIVAYDDNLLPDLGFDEDLSLIDESKKVEGKKIEEGEAELYKKKINKTDIKKVESKEPCPNCGKEECVCEAKKEEAPKRHVINKVDLRKTESITVEKEAQKDTKEAQKDIQDHLKTKVAEGLTKFVKEAYTNGKEVKVEKVLKLTENKLYVKGSLVMENSTRDFSCKLIPVMENKSFRKYTIKENKLLKITEGKTTKGKEFNLIVKK